MSTTPCISFKAIKVDASAPHINTGKIHITGDTNHLDN